MIKMSNQIRFKLGRYETYTATRGFDLGAHAGLKIGVGDEVAFDGTVMQFAGMEVSQPQLRGAIRMGWLVPAASYNPNARQAAPAANIQMRPADGGDPMNPNPARTASTTVAAEEQEVMDVGAHAAQTKERNATNYRRTPSADSTQGQRSNTPVIEEQDGVEVRSIKTPARQDTNLGKKTVGQAIAEAKATSKIQPGAGMSQEQMLSAMTDEDREEYLSEIESRKGQYVTEQDSQVVRQVGAPKPIESTGIKVATSVGGGTEIADPSSGERAPQNVVRVEEGIKFTETSPVKKPVQPQQQPVAPADEGSSRKIAKSICEDFPDNYVFTDPTRKKIARLQADYDDRPDIIRAVAAADTDPEVRNRLLEEFPQAFSG